MEFCKNFNEILIRLGDTALLTDEAKIHLANCPICRNNQAGQSGDTWAQPKQTVRNNSSGIGMHLPTIDTL